MTLDDLDDRLAVTFKGSGWAHRQIVRRMRFKSKQGGAVHDLALKSKKARKLSPAGF